MMVQRTPSTMLRLKNDYEDNKDPEFRRKSFKSFSDGIRKYQHTTAATYNMQVQQEKLKLIYVDLNQSSIIYYIVKK